MRNTDLLDARAHAGVVEEQRDPDPEVPTKARERANLAEALLKDTIRKQHIERHQLTIHADRGSSMASKPVAHHNNEHRHSGIAFHSPADVHHGRADTIRAHREVLDAAYAANSDCFVRHPPTPPALPEAAWINKPGHAPGLLT